MALVADDLLAAVADLPRHRRRPVALGRVADHHQRPPVRGVPALHRLERVDHGAVVVPLRHLKCVPSVGGPLGDEVVVARVLPVDHAAEERVVDAGVVLGDHDPESLANFERERLRLELLRVPFGHRELALEGDHLGTTVDRCAEDVPECGLAGGGGDADARRPAVHVVGQVRRFGVARQGPDPTDLRLGEQRVVCQSFVSARSVASAPAPRRNPSASIGSIAIAGSTK